MKAFLRCPVTCALFILIVSVYLIEGSGRDLQSVTSVPDHLYGLFRHGDVTHLLINCALLAIGGWMTEPRIGPGWTACLCVGCVAMGLGAEFILSGPGFIGISGAAYGLMAFGMIAEAPPGQRPFTILLIGLALTAEVVLLREDFAVYMHLAAAITGGGIAMIASLFGSKGPALKPMEWKHVSRVVQIIAQTDEDDALEAENTLIDSGYENMFVLVDRGQVLGLTGYGLDEHAPDLAWLSWTYLDEAEMGKGLGSKMLDDLLGMLAKQGVRKIFIETSDYEEDGEKIYASAHKLYEEFGAEVELTLPDYHAPGEAKIIYGLENPEAPATPEPDEPTDTGLRFTGLQDAPETDNVAGLTWDEAPVGVAGLDHYLTRAKEKNYRMAVLTLPDDLSQANREALETHGFQHKGTLEDYYCTGSHQEWWSCAL